MHFYSPVKSVNYIYEKHFWLVTRVSVTRAW